MLKTLLKIKADQIHEVASEPVSKAPQALSKRSGLGALVLAWAF